jgi:hypothetical protein
MIKNWVSRVTVAVQYTDQIRIRERNTLLYRFLHWPIWITVFYLAPGPLTFDLFAKGFDRRMAIWLVVVCLGTGIAGLRGRLPGVEPRPYIIRFNEDRLNPLYRRVCYTAAWSDLITYAVLNVIGILDAIARGKWHLAQIYDYGWLPVAGVVWLLGLSGILPRTKHSTVGEGAERGVFYGTIWAVTWSQVTLGILWVVLSTRHTWSRSENALMLMAFMASLGGLSYMAWHGRLPRTRKIVTREQQSLASSQ